MSLQANIFLLLFGTIQGFLLSIALLRKRERHVSHIFLTVFLVVVGLQLTFKVITKMWLMNNIFFAYAVSYHLPFLAAAAMYLFIRARTTSVTYHKTDLLHAIPFLFYCTISVLKYFGFHGYYLGLDIDWIRALAQIISLGIYFGMSRLLIESSGGNSNRTLRQFLHLVTSVEAIVAITLAVSAMYYGRIPDIRLLFILITVVIYWITWKMMTDSELLQANQALRYSHSSLKNAEALRIETELRKQVSLKVFTDSKLTIDKLATLLQTNRHHLSQVLNERIHQSYNDFISELRVGEARRRLADPQSERYTIAAIALDSGFSAVSTFNDSFKKAYGVTPSAFRTDALGRITT